MAALKSVPFLRSEVITSFDISSRQRRLMPLHGFQMPRIDRLATVYVCHPLARLTGWTSRYCVPVLAYHSISEHLFGKLHPYHQINTSASVFAQQMSWLRRAGCRTTDLPEW